MQLPPSLFSDSRSAPRVGVRVGDSLHPAVTVHLDGHRASLRFEDGRLQEEWAQHPTMPEGRTDLHLHWADGSVTKLSVAVRFMDVPSQVAHLEIHGVEGDWRPFLEYLALQA